MSNPPAPDAQKLANPPIVEAVFDVQTRLSSETTQENLENGIRSLDGYSALEQLILYKEQRTFPLGEGEVESRSGKSIRGFRAFSPDKKNVVQFRMEGFSFNRLAPYTSYDDYISEVRRCWEAFAAVSYTEEITKLELRYINKISIPSSGPTVNLDEYFTIVPRVPKIPEYVCPAFLNQIHLRPTAPEFSDLLGKVTLMPDMETAAGFLNTILDNSAIIHSGAKTITPEIMWEEFARLRHLKDKIFFDVITDKCKSLFA